MSWHDRAMTVTPGGAQTRSKRASAFPWDPVVLTHGLGAKVWDTNSKGYIDWICGLGAISLGYQYRPVDSAVREQLVRGVSFSLPTHVEVQTAEALVELLGWPEQVRFVKTGSEATEGAMRIARLATGRDLILSIGYHGWHAQHDAANQCHPGVPDVFNEVVQGMPWGQPLPEISGVAGVLVEICRDEPPPRGWLAEIRDWCTRRGALMIADEMVTGFRWATGGASEYFGVQPDLACYGKGLANGYPLAAIVGRRPVMEDASYVSGTFGGEALSLAACAATLHTYKTQPVISTMWTVGSVLMDEFNALKAGLAMAGYPVHPRIEGDGRWEFLRKLAHEGVLMHPSGFNISFAHGEHEVAATIAACKRALG